MLNKMVPALAFLLIAISLCSASLPVNETVGNYRISFEAPENSFSIIKAWNLQNLSGFKIGEFDDSEALVDCIAVGALNYRDSSSGILGVGVLTLKEPVYTSDFNMKILNNSDDYYYCSARRTTIDGHYGIYDQEYNDLNDKTNQLRTALYWLDETDNSMGTELVIIFVPSGINITDSEMMTLLNTTHVEKLASD